MDNLRKRLLELEEFAKNRLVNGNEELQTTYLGRRIHPRDQQIPEMELQDKIEELLSKENAYKRESLFGAFPQQH